MNHKHFLPLALCSILACSACSSDSQQSETDSDDPIITDPNNPGDPDIDDPDIYDPDDPDNPVITDDPDDQDKSVPPATKCDNECNANDKECLNTGIQICAMVDGCYKWTKTPCPDNQFCDPSTFTCTNSCQNLCESGQTKCVKDEIYTCIDSNGCMNWSEPSACKSNQTCVSDKCDCKVSCQIGEKECDGNQLQLSRG